LGILFGPSLINETASHYRLLNAALIDELDSEYISCRTYDHLGTSRQAELDTVLAHLRTDQKSFDFRGYVCVTSIPDSVPIDQLIPPSAPRAMSDRNQPGNDILFDYYDFGAEIVKALQAKNARKLWCMGYPSVDNQLAFDAARVAAAACGLAEPVFYELEVHPQSEMEIAAYHATLALLDRYKTKHERPEAIMISDDIAARGVVFALLARGLRVPEDVRVGILGNEGVNIFYSVPVIRYDYPIRTVAKRLADFLVQRMAGRQTPSAPVTIKGTLSEGF
jgi:DNA-binding LacI/PurR family transcriptional regulator